MKAVEKYLPVLLLFAFFHAPTAVFSDVCKLKNSEIIYGKFIRIEAENFVIISDGRELRIPIVDVENLSIEPASIAACVLFTDGKEKCGQRFHKIQSEELIVYDRDSGELVRMPLSDVNRVRLYPEKDDPLEEVLKIGTKIAVVHNSIRQTGTVQRVGEGTIELLNADNSVQSVSSVDSFEIITKSEVAEIYPPHRNGAAVSAEKKDSLLQFIPGLTQIAGGESFRGYSLLTSFTLLSFYTLSEYLTARSIAVAASNDIFCSCYFDNGRQARELESHKQRIYWGLTGLAGIYLIHLWDLHTEGGAVTGSKAGLFSNQSQIGLTFSAHF